MKPTRNDSINRPFSRLKDLVEKKQLHLAACPECKPDRPPRLSHQQEAELFARAMDGVIPLKHKLYGQRPRRSPMLRAPRPMEDESGVAALRRLIQTGHGFVISQTDEYMEASRPGMDPRITRRLHRGNYTIQDHIDLHGLMVRDAEPVLHRFIKRCIRRGCQAVLIIHGRGLRSPSEPVLKAKVFHWLTRGPLRAHVIALTSARACDGGTGATYVLLRRRPMGKQQRKAMPMVRRR